MLDPHSTYLIERVAVFADLSGRRLLHEIRKLGHEGNYLALKPFLREVRPPVRTQIERWFETPPGQQAQVEFAAFNVAFTDEPGVTRKVWMFSPDEPSMYGIRAFNQSD
ncbi:MAG: hypothetical protein P8P84_16300 [Paracoccaceae bacterium]|nr:hypothetical protein [Paracoccaceae bacterium]